MGGLGPMASGRPHDENHLAVFQNDSGRLRGGPCPTERPAHDWEVDSESAIKLVTKWIEFDRKDRGANLSREEAQKSQKKVTGSLVVTEDCRKISGAEGRGSI